MQVSALAMVDTDPFKYSRAVVCGVPASLPEAALRLCEPANSVDLQRAREQHEKYMEVLGSIVPEVHVIPVDESLPDCVFVEDPVVVCDDTALITIPGHDSRQGEAVSMKAMMEKLGVRVVEMSNPGRMDGGDVLFTGKEFFVGLSQRTNQTGLSQLAGAFPGYPVTGIPVKEGLHLKSFLSMAGPNLIAIGSSTASQEARKQIEALGKFRYSFLQCPDDLAANCVYANGTLIHVSKEAFPNSVGVFEQLPGKRIALTATELNKVDGALTCCSVLIQ